MRVTLGDILEQRDLGLQLLTGGPAVREVAVDGAHSIDLPDAVRWLQENWVMLTTGVQLRGRLHAQRQLVAELADGGIAALGLGLGIAVHRVPSALLREAERRDFPLFTIPLEVPFREIISFVNRSVLSTDLYVLQRLTSMQRYLMDALHHPLPERTLVERLGSVLGGADVAYLDSAGSVVATTAPAMDWPDLARTDPTSRLHEFEHAGRRGVVAPVLDTGRAVGWLVVVLESVTVSRQVARPVMRTASDLLGLVSVTRAAATSRRRADRERLGRRLGRVIGGEADAELAAALAVDGIDFTAVCHVAVMRAREADMGPARKLAAAALYGFPTSLVVVDGGYELTVLAQDNLRHLGEWLAASPDLSRLATGISEPLVRFDQLPVALRQARLALGDALVNSRDGTIRRHEELDPAVALVGAAAGDPLVERLVHVLEPLAAEPRLEAAVVAYFEADLDIGRAAHALGLHRNSLRYRLARAEQLLGRSLRAPATVATLHLALLAQRAEAESSRAGISPD